MIELRELGPTFVASEIWFYTHHDVWSSDLAQSRSWQLHGRGLCLQRASPINYIRNQGGSPNIYIGIENISLTEPPPAPNIPIAN